MKGHRNAFTLIELLVVIAVLGILAALLLPVLSSGKSKAGQVCCQNNLKQMGTGLLMYLDDSQSIFPGLASKRNGFQATDWIYWRTNSALYHSRPDL
jgi:prepilin-type N-terminal cleavage/methylation domain-containing protein